MKRKWIAMGARGFTLIELMIVIGVFAGVSGAGYAIYSVQQRTYLMQEQLVDLQQSVRTFLFYIEKDLRMAGYDPRRTGFNGFQIAHSTEAVFCADIGRPRTSPVDCDGAGCDTMPDGNIMPPPSRKDCPDCVVETVRYALNPTPTPQSNGQVADTKVTTVQKTFNGDTNDGSQSVVENVQALEFLYNLNNGTAVTAVPTADLNNIRSVTVSLLMRTHNPIRGYRSKDKYYCPASNPEIIEKDGTSHCVAPTGKRWGPFNDTYRRRLVVTNIQCRNMAFRDDDK